MSPLLEKWYHESLMKTFVSLNQHLTIVSYAVLLRSCVSACYKDNVPNTCCKHVFEIFAMASPRTSKHFLCFKILVCCPLVSQNVVFMLANSFIAVKRFATLSLRGLLISNGLPVQPDKTQRGGDTDEGVLSPNSLSRQLGDQMTLCKSYAVIAKENSNLQLAWHLSAQIRASQQLLSLVQPCYPRATVLLDT